MRGHGITSEKAWKNRTTMPTEILNPEPREAVSPFIIKIHYFRILRFHFAGSWIFLQQFPKKISNVIEHVRKTLTTEETLEGVKTYLDICRAPLAVLCLAVGETREFCDLLRGLRFTMVDRFKRGLTQDFLEDKNSEMGGVVYEKENAENLMKSLSNILNFYVIVKDEENLINATGEKHQLKAMGTKLKLHRHCSANELSTVKMKILQQKRSYLQQLWPAKDLRRGGLMLITVDYVLKMKKSTVFLDPEIYIS